MKSKKKGFENGKGQIQVAGFTLADSDIFCKSHDFWPVDILGIIAVFITGTLKRGKDDILNFGSA